MLDRLLGRLGGRDKVIRLLTVVVVIGIPVWVVAEAGLYIAIFGFGGNGGFTASWMKWAQILSRVAFDVWLGALALLLLLWLVHGLANAAPLPTDRNGHRDTDLPD